MLSGPVTVWQETTCRSTILTVSFPARNQACVCYRGQRKQVLPFSLLLNLRQTPSIPREKSLCYAQSPNGLCLRVACMPGRTLDKGKCILNTNDLTGIGYRLLVWLEPEKSYNLTDTSLAVVYNKQIMDSLINKTVAALEGLSERLTINIQSIVDDSSQIQYIYPYIRLECTIVPNRYISKTMFEKEHAYLWYQLNEDYFKKIFLNDIFPTFMVKFHDPRDRNYNLLENVNKEQLIMLNKTYEIVDSRFKPRMVREYTRLSRVLNCLIIQFHQSYYSFHIDDKTTPRPKVTVTLVVESIRIEITEDDHLNGMDIDANGTLNVCLEILSLKMGLMVYDKDRRDSSLPEDDATQAEYILSMTCLTGSIVCVLLTLFTYFMFPVLRTEAGVNNMFLSFSLLSAQVSLLVSSHFFRSSVECVILGITTHFMWLWMFSWSLICSHHMYRVFTSATPRTTPQNHTRRLWTKVIFSLSCPTAIVVTTILSSYFTSQGTQLGYGLVTCYLDSSLLVGVSVVGPMSVTTIVNVVFYIITVYTIYKVRQMQSSFSNTDQQANWFIYLRLSAVTGAFWVVAIIASALDNQVFRFISIVLNGLQGVAIFASYICNKRVLNLYSQLRMVRTESAVDMVGHGQTVTTSDM